jgi:hypothetical protein
MKRVGKRESLRENVCMCVCVREVESARARARARERDGERSYYLGPPRLSLPY